MELSGPTISSVVTEYPVHGRTRIELFHAADAALHDAKYSGREQIVVASARNPARTKPSIPL